MNITGGNKKNILIAITSTVMLAFCLILLKSYRIAQINGDENSLPVIRAESDVVKVKQETRELEFKTNSFYDNLNDKDEKVNINVTDGNINTNVGRNSEQITQKSELDNEINNVVNNSEFEVNNDDIVLNENIKTVKINENSRNQKTEELKNVIKVEPRKKIELYKAQLIALKNKQQAQDFINKTKKVHSNLSKDFDIFMYEIDLGNKGIFYRVQVGDFNTKNDAQSFCKEYLKVTTKSATNCIVVK